MCSLPGPPSSHPPSLEYLHVSRQHVPPMPALLAAPPAGGFVAAAPGQGPVRGPQSAQSVPCSQHGKPPHHAWLKGPPSSHPPSFAYAQVSRQHTSPACPGGTGRGGTGRGGTARGGTARDGTPRGGIAPALELATPPGGGLATAPGGGGDGVGGGGGGGSSVPGGYGVGGGGVRAGGGQRVARSPQSSQSDPTAQHGKPLQVCSEPGPPSSQSPSRANRHVLSQHWDAARPKSRLSASTNDSNDRIHTPAAPVVSAAGSGCDAMGLDM